MASVMEMQGSLVSTPAAGTPGDAASGGSTAASTPVASNSIFAVSVQNPVQNTNIPSNPNAPVGKPRRPHHKSRTGTAPFTIEI